LVTGFLELLAGRPEQIRWFIEKSMDRLADRSFTTFWLSVWRKSTRVTVLAVI
jgi:hypothetical protein